jgi:hypothetical protein
MYYVGLTDFTGQRFVVEVPKKVPATAAHVAYDQNEIEALQSVRERIVHSKPIKCDIIHDNSRAPMTVIFMGPVRLDIAPEETA